jgi:hypothetical protein
MKILFVFLIICCSCYNSIAQNIDGIWSSTSGNQFQIEENNSGFLCKNLRNNYIVQAVYFGDNGGSPTYRADFPDGTFQLYMIVSAKKIRISNSASPSVVQTWTKQIERENTQYQSGSAYPVQQNNQREPKTCTACRGTGQSSSVTYPPNYGTPTVDEWCSTCKAMRKPHTHKLCLSCGGLGEK